MIDAPSSSREATGPVTFCSTRRESVCLALSARSAGGRNDDGAEREDAGGY